MPKMRVYMRSPGLQRGYTRSLSAVVSELKFLPPHWITTVSEAAGMGSTSALAIN